jgi:CelD/BcsL family acetyltransferase involved in cellulose biosynthesis
MLGGQMTGGLTGGEVVTTAAAFDALAEEWEALYRRSPHATPFLAHGWLSAYWHAFGEPGALRVVLLRDGARRLTVAAPLRLRRQPGLTVLAVVADDLSDFTDVLIDPAAPDVHMRLARGLLELPGWDVLDAPEVAAGSVLSGLRGSWPGPTVTLPASTCLELPAAPVERLLAELPGKTRSDLRRKLRLADELGLRPATAPTDAAEIAAAVAELLDLHARQWAGRPVNGLHLSDAFRRHLTAAAQLMVPAGQAALTRHLLAGSVAAVSLFLLTGDTVGGYLYGVDPLLRSRVDMSALMIRSGLELGRSRGAARLNMLRGDEPAKLRWRPQIQRNQRLLLLPPTATRGHLAAAGTLVSRAGRDLLGRSPRAVQVAHRLNRRHLGR